MSWVICSEGISNIDLDQQTLQDFKHADDYIILEEKSL